MSRDPLIRQRRHEAIRKIFESGQRIEEQKELVELLLPLGFEVTQSSVSRDLRDLGAFRRDGRYELQPRNYATEAIVKIWSYVTGLRPIGETMILLEVQRGAASLVTGYLDKSEWTDLVGTLASADDKVLVFTEDKDRQKNAIMHFNVLVRHAIRED